MSATKMMAPIRAKTYRNVYVVSGDAPASPYGWFFPGLPKEPYTTVVYTKTHAKRAAGWLRQRRYERVTISHYSITGRTR